MAIDVSKVLVGAPNQKTTGAIMDAPLGTALPTSATAATTGFTGSGYITEDGLSLTIDRSTKDLTDWSGATVRKVLENFDGTLSWSEMEMSYEALCHAFGKENVKKVVATKDHGEQITVEVGAELPEARSWVFNMVDGNNAMRVVVPNGQVTEIDEITFAATDSINLPLTLACYPDSNGKSIYIYTDDGNKAAA